MKRNTLKFLDLKNKHFLLLKLECQLLSNRECVIVKLGQKLARHGIAIVGVQRSARKNSIADYFTVQFKIIKCILFLHKEIRLQDNGHQRIFHWVKLVRPDLNILI